jgi:hypothetical protein
MPPAGFEPAVTASERPQTHVSDRAATGIDQCSYASHNGPANFLRLLWAGSRASCGKTSVYWYTSLPKLLWNVCSMHTIYKCGRQPQNTTWQDAGFDPCSMLNGRVAIETWRNQMYCIWRHDRDLFSKTNTCQTHKWTQNMNGTGQTQRGSECVIGKHKHCYYLQQLDSFQMWTYTQFWFLIIHCPFLWQRLPCMQSRWRINSVSVY